MAFHRSSFPVEHALPRGAYAFHTHPTTFTQKVLTGDQFAKLYEQVKIKGKIADPKKLLSWHFLKTTYLIFCIYTLELESMFGLCSCKTLWLYQQGDKRLYNLFASFRHVNTSIKQAHNSQATCSWAALDSSMVKT